MNRLELQELAEIRLDEAATLLSHGKWDGAYYLAGYAVECAIKACIAKKTSEHDFPDKQFVNECHTHNLAALLRLAQLESSMKADTASNVDLKNNWFAVRDWNEHSRYQRHDQSETQLLFDAINDLHNGVFPWMKARW